MHMGAQMKYVSKLTGTRRTTSEDGFSLHYVVSGSASLQTELENIEKIIPKYTPLAEAAQTQVDMNISSQWFFVIWDTELNNLWSRISNSADQQTKERILAEQRNWRRMGVGETMAEKGLQDIFGGRVYGIRRPDGNYHCYNVVGDCCFDLTSEQFGDEVLDYQDNPEQFRETHFAKEEKRLRYEYLKNALQK